MIISDAYPRILKGEEYIPVILSSLACEKEAIITAYHENHTSLDIKFINQIFEKDERCLLSELRKEYPDNTIRMPNSDLIANGFIVGIGGSVHRSFK